MAELSRKEFLGGLGCATAGTLAGAYIPGALAPRFANDRFVPKPIPTSSAVRALPPTHPLHGGEESFSQCGEDVNVYFTFKFFSMFGGAKITYMDIGAHHPTEINNTYFFYRKGYRGVLIEPNGALCGLLSGVRPDDTTLEAGIGISDAKEADYYLMNESALNTFSKEQAERLVANSGGKFRIEEVRKVPLLNVNAVMEEHFRGAPTFVSIDTEGLDLDILKTFDFVKYRPKVICVETLVSTTRTSNSGIARYLATRNYTPRGGSIVNTIFIDNVLLS